MSLMDCHNNIENSRHHYLASFETALYNLLSSYPLAVQKSIHKIIKGQRISTNEGLFLFQKADDVLLQKTADYIRYRMHGNVVDYCHTQYIHPTNLCELSCPMCSYYAKPGWEKAWFLTPEMIEKKVRHVIPKGVCEIHIVGGLWRECTLDYYQDIFTRIKNISANIHIKALTPVEYAFLSQLHAISIEEVFKKMISWGLGSLPGGGAEILVEEIRRKIAPGKISSEEYLRIHKIAHTLHLPSNITMLFGHIESEKHIIQHLESVRNLQDITHGFKTFVPLKYHEENNALGKRRDRLQPKDVRRIYAISRIMLDNVPNIKVLWNYIGVETAQDILHWGANDFSSTSLEEKIITMAGGIGAVMTEGVMENLIRSQKRIPRKTHSGQVNHHVTPSDHFHITNTATTTL